MFDFIKEILDRDSYSDAQIVCNKLHLPYQYKDAEFKLEKDERLFDRGVIGRYTITDDEEIEISIRRDALVPDGIFVIRCNMYYNKGTVRHTISSIIDFRPFDIMQVKSPERIILTAFNRVYIASSKRKESEVNDNGK